MNLVKFILRVSWPAVLLASLAGTVSGAATIGLIALVHRALGRAGGASAGTIAAFAGLVVLVLVTRAGSQNLVFRLGHHAVFRLCTQLSRRIVAAPLRHLEELGPHRILAALTEDVLVIAMAFNFLPQIFINATIALCCLAYLGWLSPAALAVVPACAVLGFVAFRLVAGRAMHHQRAARQEHDVLMGHFQGLIEGIKELKLHAERREAFLVGMLEASAAAVRDRLSSAQTLITAAGSGIRLLVLGSIGVLLFVLPAWTPLDPPTLTGCTLALLFALSPLEGLMGTGLSVLNRARIALDKVESLGLRLASAGPEKEESGGTPVPSWTSLELRGVTHAYRREQQDECFVLGPLDLRLHPGELVFLIGGNGSGKSTLAKLLTGLYVPEQGEVLLDGNPVLHGARDGYRRLFSAVFSDFHLFEHLLGLEGGRLDARAREYLKLLHLDRLVRVQDGRLSTTELSHGQRKRLALLTAYLEDRPICVFDEWAADQDPVFKRVFYTELLPELKARGKAVVVISHDDHYFGVADRILKLVEGKLHEEEAFPGLPTRNGLPIRSPLREGSDLLPPPFEAPS
jgi:putative ATP-binding cassette transporter